MQFLCPSTPSVPFTIYIVLMIKQFLTDCTTPRSEVPAPSLASSSTASHSAVSLTASTSHHLPLKYCSSSYTNGFFLPADCQVSVSSSLTTT